MCCNVLQCVAVCCSVYSHLCVDRTTPDSQFVEHIWACIDLLFIHLSLHYNPSNITPSASTIQRISAKVCASRGSTGSLIYLVYSLTRRHTHAHTHANSGTHTHIHMNAHARTHKHRYIYVYIYVCIYVFEVSKITRTHINTRTHSYVNTYIITHILSCAFCLLQKYTSCKERRPRSLSRTHAHTHKHPNAHTMRARHRNWTQLHGKPGRLFASTCYSPLALVHQLDQ